MTLVEALHEVKRVALASPALKHRGEVGLGRGEVIAFECAIARGERDPRDARQDSREIRISGGHIDGTLWIRALHRDWLGGQWSPWYALDKARVSNTWSLWSTQAGFSIGDILAIDWMVLP